MKIQTVTSAGVATREATKEELAQQVTDKADAVSFAEAQQTKETARTNVLKDIPTSVNTVAALRSELNALKAMLRGE